MSAGETRATQPLIDTLLTRFPHRAALLTYMALTGHHTGAKFAVRRSGRIIQVYLSYDLPSVVDWSLHHFQSRLDLLTEIEV